MEIDNSEVHPSTKVSQDCNFSDFYRKNDQSTVNSTMHYYRFFQFPCTISRKPLNLYPIVNCASLIGNMIKKISTSFNTTKRGKEYQITD